MATIVFKRLFEVQVLHDYFLTDQDGISFFDKNEVDKLEVLKQKLIYQLYNVRKQFSIQPTSATQRLLDHYKLRFAPTAIGFLVGIEVVAEPQNNDTTFYRPRIELKSNSNFQFSIISKNPLLQNFTNSPLQDSIFANYYFTNTAKEKLLNALPISGRVSTYQAGNNYEMGALADFSNDPNIIDLKEASENAFDDVSLWESIPDRRWVNENDKQLLPHQFSYVFHGNQNITTAVFVLLDGSNTEIKTISKTSPTPIAHVALSFLKVDEEDENSANIAPGFYTLKIKAGSNPEVIRRVYLNDDLYQKNQLGIVDIQLKEQGTEFSILDNNGFLKTRINNGVKVPHPIFELRFRNRKTYWRYKSDHAFTATEIADTNAHLDQVSNFLLSSKKTRPLTQTYTPFVNGTSLNLPSPRVTPLRFSNGKIFSDVFINKTNPLLKE